MKHKNTDEESLVVEYEVSSSFAGSQFHIPFLMVIPVLWISDFNEELKHTSVIELSNLCSYMYSCLLY